MNSLRNKTLVLIGLFLFTFNVNSQPTPQNQTNIQVAILLDTSNSMDGLIEQAKSRLWNIVNTLTTLKYNGVEPKIEIALYEYGNDRLSYDNNYIRQVMPLSHDLDLISEKLFALTTNGGDEYCGAVINKAVNQLKWSDGKSLKLIYIAGNEPFNQGPIDYKASTQQATSKNIYVNTIFCGTNYEGINTAWQDGAINGKGKYFAINANEKVIYYATPYDDLIEENNVKLNKTYLGYGTLGAAKKQAQLIQDNNAKSISKENNITRTISKTKGNAYNNAQWDIVDKYKQDSSYVLRLDDSKLPKEMQGKTQAQKKTFLRKLEKERESIQNEITELSAKRKTYIAEEKKKNSKLNNSDDLGTAIEKSIYEIAASEGFEY